MVLPFPYAQLLKVLMLVYISTLPFVLVHEMGWGTPVVAAVVATAFFGLDQVGAELEGPFGIDANDFSLIKIGLNLCKDLDGMLRSISRTRVLARINYPKEEQIKVREAAAALGWRHGPTSRNAPRVE